MKVKDLKSHLRKVGYIDRNEAAEILGMSNGGNLPKVLSNVQAVTLPGGQEGRNYCVYNEDEVRQIAALRNACQGKKVPDGQMRLPGGTENGGKLSSRISLLEDRIEKLEAFMKQFE